MDIQFGAVMISCVASLPAPSHYRSFNFKRVNILKKRHWITRETPASESSDKREFVIVQNTNSNLISKF